MTDKSPWIELRSGTKFYTDVDPWVMAKQIHVEDIAHSLSYLCRYNGHVRRFYSVAEHCCLMSDYVEHQGGTPEECLVALHHDDAEYIIGDVARDIKQDLPDFKGYEQHIEMAVRIRFGFTELTPPWLKELDARIIIDERRQVMAPSNNRWDLGGLDPLGVETWDLRGRFPYLVKRAWLRRHKRLMYQWAHDSDSTLNSGL